MRAPNSIRWTYLTRSTTSLPATGARLWTGNAIESSFATVKLRNRMTKGAGSKKARWRWAYKLLDAAQERWKRFNGHELVADLLAGAKFRTASGSQMTETTTTK